MGSAIGLSPLQGGVNSLLSPLGLGGEQGDYFKPAGNAGTVNLLNRQALYQNQPGAAQNYSDYGTGKMSLQDALSKGQGMKPEEQMQYQNDLATNSNSGSQFATDQVQNNGILGQLFGQGGALSRANDEEQQLSKQGYSLTPEDHTAYGQASGDIARMFGTQEAGLSQSLADRGLASAPSGAAGVGFSGLQGNKMEQLAKAQTDIADKRMQNNLARLSETRSYLTNLGQQGAADINQQYGRQLQGAQNDTANSTAASGAADRSNQANLESLQDQRAAKGKTIFDALGSGIYSGVAGAASALPGMATGGMGSSAAAAGTPKPGAVG